MVREFVNHKVIELEMAGLASGTVRNRKKDYLSPGRQGGEIHREDGKNSTLRNWKYCLTTILN